MHDEHSQNDGSHIKNINVHNRTERRKQIIPERLTMTNSDENKIL